MTPPAAPASAPPPAALALDLVSPLPPTPTGIADYSVDLAAPLGARCALRLARLPGQDVDPALGERWPLIDFAAVGEGGRLPLYQMGNNHLHQAVWDAALRVPGVVTLHDLVLHHFQLGRFLGFGRHDPDGLAAQLAADHGWAGEAVAAALRWSAFGDAAQFSLPVNRTLALAARGVLVHSRWAAERLAEEVPEARVRAVPMAVPLPPPADPAAGLAFRRQHGIPNDAPLLGSFGFQTPMKRTAVAIRAIARPELAAARLLVAGAVAATLDLETVARQAGVANRVHLLGYLPFAGMEAAIAACDLALNLRHPTAGETSASLLRVLAVGRPALVTDYAQFAELPDEGVLKVPAGDDEVAALACTVGELVTRPKRLRQMGEAARGYVRRAHDPERAADAVVEACAEWAELPPPGRRARRLAPPTSTTWGHLPGRLEVTGGEGWSAGERRRLRLRLTNDGPAVWRRGEVAEGGVVVEVSAAGGGEPLAPVAGWLPLPRDLAPGESQVLEVAVRRGRGRFRLRVEPRVLGGLPFSSLGGSSWERRW